MARIYDYETIFNFRDFGGYEGAGGARVAEGKLFRSAHLSRLSDVELAAIADHRISLVVDMRYQPERLKQPNRVPDGARLLEHIPGEGETDHKVAPHEVFLQHDLKTATDTRGYMTNSYAARPNSGGFRRLASETLNHMAETGAPVLIHCAAGKDRTGTLAAIVHSVLGVSDDDILADYMMTLKAVDIEPFLGPAAARMSKTFGREIDPEHLRPMFGVEPGYLQIALDVMDATPGGRDGYLDALGADVVKRDAIRAAYLV